MTAVDLVAAGERDAPALPGSETEAVARLDAILARRGELRAERAGLAAERARLEQDRGASIFDGGAKATQDRAKRRARIAEIDIQLGELAEGLEVGEARIKAARTDLACIRRAAEIAKARKIGPLLEQLAESCDRSAAAFGQDYARLRKAMDFAVVMVSSAFTDRMQVLDFQAGQADAGRLASVAAMYVAKHGGPETSDETGLAYPAASQADAPSIVEMVRGKAGFLMSILGSLATEPPASAANDAQPIPGGLALPVATPEGDNVVRINSALAELLGPPVPVFPNPAEVAPASQPEFEDDDAARAARADAVAAAEPAAEPAPLTPSDVAALAAVKGGNR